MSGLSLTPNNPDLAPPADTPSPKECARYIDHTFLKPEGDVAAITKLCNEAKEYGFFSVCVNSANVALAKRLVADSDVKVCAVVGFPLGAGTPASKAFETEEAVKFGADEIDMVLNIGALKSKQYQLVTEDIAGVVAAADGRFVKVILETSKLNEREKVIGCVLSKVAGAAFVKTSTGFGGGGATPEDVALMRSVVGPDVGVKASGGVRTYEDAVAVLRAGANRIGASSGIAIVTEAEGTGEGY